MLIIEGLDGFKSQKLALKDAAEYALAAPAAAAAMGERLGLLARSRSRSPMTLGQLGRGQVLVKPSTGERIAIDAVEILRGDQRDAVDRIAMHLGWQSFTHSGPAKILASALVVERPNEPTRGFWELACHLGKFSSIHRGSAERKLLFWAAEVKRVHDWFAQYERDHPFKGEAAE